MTSPLLAGAAYSGTQPSHLWLPPSIGSPTGAEALRLAEIAGVELLGWQEFVTVSSLAERADGKWSAFEVGLCVARQNGKNEVALVRQLVGLFLLPDEWLLIHCAHLADTAREHFRRLCTVIEAVPALKERVKRIARSRGDEGIELHDGSRILFKSRNTGGGGRGFTGDAVFMDESMDLSEDTIGDLLPTLSTRPNAQLWYMGSAVDQVQFPDGRVFARVRERGHAGGDPLLMWVEFCAPGDHPDEVTADMAADPETWRKANPSMGPLIEHEAIKREHRAMPRRKFAVERLSVGDWPNTEEDADAPWDVDAWRALEDAASHPLDAVCLAFDVSPSRRDSCIGIAGTNEDGNLHVEVVDRFRGTAGLLDRIIAVHERHDFAEVLCDGASPAASLIPALEAAGITVRALTVQEMARACGQMADLVDHRAVRHLGTTELLDALRAAVKRNIGDGQWALSRRNSTVDISPLVAIVGAGYGVSTASAAAEPFMFWLT